jgi:hypothetical protein
VPVQSSNVTEIALLSVAGIIAVMVVVLVLLAVDRSICTHGTLETLIVAPHPLGAKKDFQVRGGGEISCRGILVPICSEEHPVIVQYLTKSVLSPAEGYS